LKRKTIHQENPDVVRCYVKSHVKAVHVIKRDRKTDCEFSRSYDRLRTIRDVRLARGRESRPGHLFL